MLCQRRGLPSAAVHLLTRPAMNSHEDDQAGVWFGYGATAS